MKTAVIVLLAAFTAACSAPGTRGPADRLKVTASFYPLAEVARRVGADRVAVTDLTPPGAEPHDLELKPSDVTGIKASDLVMYLRGLQPSVDDAVKKIGARAIDMFPVAGGTPGDPHVWLDPTRLIAIVERARDLFSAALPQGADAFRTESAAYIASLRALETSYSNGLASCDRRDIVTNHAAFGYLANAFGLHQLAITGITPESEPTPDRLREIVNEARAAHATVVFAESIISPRAAAKVASAIGAKVEVLDPIESLTPAEQRSHDDYISIMKRNLTMLRGALGCR